ncbi:DUF3570 domain-containing protein [Hymenobacter sp. UV11]|uniref:DUF3570 domain-containing protein n=1 Tax=Hymenobacter sp. UV11 TaxID=1849735 RepID=UPI00105FDB6F|nr:DUF3570 domain-containing protein [Hymenobacter sp. UV11]TDN40596.1 hypothetical protein A8B98_14350 [Hymenobacter sp. UV11]TFZ66384.1 DUF3570 domain-containing protein [Hymenobacter sp. UV11]
MLKSLLFCLALAAPLGALAQGTPTPNRLDGSGVSPNAAQLPVPSRYGETEVDILGSYYQQNGNHSAVEGGIGDQHLTDVAPTILLNVPLDSTTRLAANVGIDYYASASSDKIDQVMSSPSASDVRYHADFGLSHVLANKLSTVGVGAGVSKEYDYLSFNLVGSWVQASADGNRQFSASEQVFLDRITLITPAELRPGGTRDRRYGSDNRQSATLSLVYAQVLSKRLQASVSIEPVVQSGLLSTPFQRVYFYDYAPGGLAPGTLGTAKAEVLPRLRYKYPASLRLTYYATDLVQLRGFYRFYNDNFGIRAHTFELEAPVKVTPFFTLYPFYRYHTQTAADYFAPYLAHSVTDEYYTSDYDLSAFSANKVGLGFRYAPLYGLGRFKTPLGHGITKFKSLDLRYGYYRQSTGLTANVVSFALSFVMP